MAGDIPWRSLDELGGDPGGVLPELAEAALVDRRMAMRLMGASFALAAAGCDRPPSRALRSAPRASIEPDHLDYATTLDREGQGFGVVVRTVGGRPVKIEGNPLHPLSRGASDAAIQAELLSLYDPDRSRAPVERGRPVTWSTARRALAEQLGQVRARRGAGLHVLLRPSASPTRQRLVAAARAALPEARWFGHTPLAPTSFASLSDAALVVSFGADPLGPGPFQVAQARDWAEARRRESGPPRLIVAEAVPTLTGARADRRLPLAPQAIAALAEAVLAVLRGTPGDATATAIAGELRAAGPRSRVLAGTDQPAATRAAANAIAALIGAPPAQPIAGETLDELPALVSALTAGAVSYLLILGGNPVYDAPADLAFAATLRRAGRSLHLGGLRDETARACTWHLPATHGLEDWGDFAAPDGTIGLAQPVVAGAATFSELAILALLAGERADARTAVRETWRSITDEAWLRALEDGVLPRPPQPTAATASQGQALSPASLTLVFRPAAHLGSGAAANNAWAQELPDPITKLVWGNAATLAPATAAKHGLANGDVVAITSQGRTIEAPVWLLPGQADDTVALTLGYGRTAAGRIGDGVGHDVGRLRTAVMPWAAPCTVKPTGRSGRLISTQRHHDVADARAFRRVAPGGRAEPSAQPTATLHTERKPKGERAWAMTIDLDACIGCAACTIACQAENNIPAVGPDEVARGREMHWLRVDRAFSGAPDEPAISFQPVPCMHCESAPCEPVCPVEATVHSSEGLNQMVYDRCIGTRSCASNCPYKVRRFNWFDYQAEPPAAPEEAQNPSVRIRERGVIEKCTYCVQRIEASRAPGSPPPVTACQQACPTQAIRFGDLSDEASDVSRDRQDPRHYQLLGGLNLRPRTTYLARVEPPND